MSTPASSTRIIRYLALGDSYTIGESVAESERWPNQLAATIFANGIQTEVTIIARTGWTTEELWQGIQADPPKGTYDLVSLLIGVNNQYRGYNIDDYRKQFRFLLNKSIEYAGGEVNRVIVVSIPDWGTTPYAVRFSKRVDIISKEIDLFNTVNHDEASLAGVRYIDVTPISRQAGGDTSFLASDGLHPSGEMYKLWAEKALPTVIDIIK